MKILFRQTPMNKAKKEKICSRCKRQVEIGEEYNLEGRLVVCDDCVSENDYINRYRIYTGRKETFGYIGNEWDVSGIIKAINNGREFKRVTRKVETLKHVNDDIYIDSKITPNVDTSIPGIMIEFPHSGILIIDGHHRIEKAIEEGKEEMEFYVLSFKEQFEYLLFKSQKDLKLWLEQRLDKYSRTKNLPKQKRQRE